MVGPIKSPTSEHSKPTIVQDSSSNTSSNTSSNKGLLGFVSFVIKSFLAAIMRIAAYIFNWSSGTHNHNFQQPAPIDPSLPLYPPKVSSVSTSTSPRSVVPLASSSKVVIEPPMPILPANVLTTAAKVATHSAPASAKISVAPVSVPIAAAVSFVEKNQSTSVRKAVFVTQPPHKPPHKPPMPPSYPNQGVPQSSAPALSTTYSQPQVTASQPVSSVNSAVVAAQEQPSYLYYSGAVEEVVQGGLFRSKVIKEGNGRLRLNLEAFGVSRELLARQKYAINIVFISTTLRDAFYSKFSNVKSYDQLSDILISSRGEKNHSDADGSNMAEAMQEENDKILKESVYCFADNNGRLSDNAEKALLAYLKKRIEELIELQNNPMQLQQQIFCERTIAGGIQPLEGVSPEEFFNRCKTFCGKYIQSIYCLLLEKDPFSKEPGKLISKESWEAFDGYENIAQLDAKLSEVHAFAREFIERNKHKFPKTVDRKVQEKWDTNMKKAGFTAQSVSYSQSQSSQEGEDKRASKTSVTQQSTVEKPEQVDPISTSGAFTASENQTDDLVAIQNPFSNTHCLMPKRWLEDSMLCGSQQSFSNRYIQPQENTSSQSTQEVTICSLSVSHVSEKVQIKQGELQDTVPATETAVVSNALALTSEVQRHYLREMTHLNQYALKSTANGNCLNYINWLREIFRSERYSSCASKVQKATFDEHGIYLDKNRLLEVSEVNTIYCSVRDILREVLEGPLVEDRLKRKVENQWVKIWDPPKIKSRDVSQVENACRRYLTKLQEVLVKNNLQDKLERVEEYQEDLDSYLSGTTEAIMGIKLIVNKYWSDLIVENPVYAKQLEGVQREAEEYWNILVNPVLAKQTSTSSSSQ
ncbi:MAG: hypothetical protein P4L16_03850 [Chlamydiales bacterium]|nr:hypothetical protein [Chlamydiales bacterium]